MDHAGVHVDRDRCADGSSHPSFPTRPDGSWARNWSRMRGAQRERGWCSAPLACNRPAVSKPGGIIGVVLPGIVLLAWGVGGTASVVGELYLHGPPYAESALQWATPDPREQRDPSAGLVEFTAARLQQLKHGSGWGPIDKYTWGAAAYSVRAGRCYLILVAEDPRNPEYGATYYGRLPARESCVGSAATRASVTSTTELPE